LEKHYQFIFPRLFFDLMTVSELAVCYTYVACDGSVLVNGGKDVEEEIIPLNLLCENFLESSEGLDESPS
jgi:hypothetical protein